MIAEIILLVAIIGIFIIVARRLPDAMREHREDQATPAAPRRWFWQGASKIEQAAPTVPNSLQLPSSSNEAQRQTVLSDDSLLKEGDEYLKTGKLKEAERAYLRGVAKNPKNPRLYNRLGAIYLKQRNYRDALEAFEAARDFDDTKASRHYNVALAAWQIGNLAKAREAIKRAISLDPQSAKYGELLVQMENPA